ncbi:hypothetical protein [Macrococcus bovicus]|uniref:hypothetical protein n=1 Tax=Macrococcus bovicus TaxID=69968 RepID=UPI00140CD335|nr:hypothetical protein [Macrococcus bovicus]
MIIRLSKKVMPSAVFINTFLLMMLVNASNYNDYTFTGCLMVAGAVGFFTWLGLEGR